MLGNFIPFERSKTNFPLADGAFKQEKKQFFPRKINTSPSEYMVSADS
jgi:hypothetical protein